ncbi:hypothetical protein [Sulfuriroseicoccus oceanibius]|uniref:Uncharacterized protein n=1 Tax=Sulfuriroseicoccus oceanibius TaxID=2707525 RepID=A0A6B3LA34_9BACT|nr:hypothetical protein [Sulfuriroseicoccus oceanibius]QQL46135.1 hypothetical protein G3M56_006015 [Sulfuriroseicoccus oceanibius]
MNRKLLVSSLCALAATLPALANDGSTQANDWVGNLSASEDRVNVGDTPSLTWNVSYPVSLDDLIDFEGDTLVAKTDVHVEARIVGAGWGTETTFYYVNGSLHNGSGWVNVFHGNQPMVSPSSVVYEDILEAGTSINAAGRGALRTGPDPSSWTSWYVSWNTTPNVIALRDGDKAPQIDPAYEIQQGVEDYLSPYVSAETGLITLGPLDVIYLFDFNDYDSRGFDLQDLAILLTFSKKQP